MLKLLDMMKVLRDLLEDVDTKNIYGSDDVKIFGVFDDSRKLKSKGIFVAVKGHTVDGHDYIEKAIEKGAISVVGEKIPSGEWLKKTTYVQVKDSQNALGIIAANWFGNPSKKLHVIGVTGTDGKTTTSSMICHILKSSGKKVGLLTTVSAKIGTYEDDTGLHVTNPEPIELQKYLAKMVDAKLNYAVLEVTSHGLSQGRVNGVSFETAVLTNITHEHLDYHKTKRDYFNAKLKLFLMAKRYAILNSDDPSSKNISDKLNENIDVVTYAIKNKAQVVGGNYEKKGKYWIFDATYEDKTTKVKLRIPGMFNVENALAAISACLAYGVKIDKSAYFLRSFSGVKGRMHEVKNKNGLKIYVDFAHTPNALERALKYLKRNKRGRLIAVFGCAGERDVEKRKLMPKASIKYADVSVFTAEDPRSEKIEDILKVMEKSARSAGGVGYKKGRKLEKHSFLSIAERGEAISFAINELSESGDTVAIFGKGHEKSMAYNGKEYPWSDFDAVEKAQEGKVKQIKQK